MVNKFQRFIDEFTGQQEGGLRAAINAEYPNIRPGRRRQMLRAIRLHREVARVSAVTTALETFLDNRGKTGTVEYQGEGVFKVVIDGVRNTDG